MQLLQKLEEIGYQVALNGNNVHLTWRGESKPDPATVRPLLEELKQRKEEAVRWLTSRQPEPDYKAEAAKAQGLLREQGWCAIESRTLGGEVVLWVRDGKVAIPERWKDAVRYTLAELEALTRPPKPGPEGLRQLHEAKRLFGGKIGADEPRGGADVGESSSSQKGADLPRRTLLGKGAARRGHDRPGSPGLLSPSGQVAG